MTRSLDPHRFRAPPDLTGPEAAAKAGVDYELARRFWLALGLPDIDESAIEFEQRDVEVLTALKRFMEAGIPPDEMLEVARVYGQALARVADAETRLFRETFIDPLLRSGVNEDELAGDLEPLVEQLLELGTAPLDYVHRRHLAIAIQNLSIVGDDRKTEPMSIAFVDLVDFSRIADDLHGEDLSDLITRFEDVAIRRCSEIGVRLVKVVGDAVMFVSPDPALAVKAATTMVQEVEADEVLPQARAGIDFGEALPLAGDYFGRPANVASRITAFARPGTVVISKDLKQAMPEDSLDLGVIGRHKLKGVGRLNLYKVRMT